MGSEPFGEGPDDSWFPPTTSRCIMRIIFAICSFICMNSATLTSEAEGLLVDISLAQDLVIIGSQHDGSLDCFLLAIFSL